MIALDCLLFGSQSEVFQLPARRWESATLADIEKASNGLWGCFHENYFGEPKFFADAIEATIELRAAITTADYFKICTNWNTYKSTVKSDNFRNLQESARGL